MRPCGHDGAARRASSMFSLGFILHRQHFFPSDDVSKRQRISKLFQKCHLIHTHTQSHTYTHTHTDVCISRFPCWRTRCRLQDITCRLQGKLDLSKLRPKPTTTTPIRPRTLSGIHILTHTHILSEAWVGRGKSQSPNSQRRLAPQNTCCT